MSIAAAFAENGIPSSIKSAPESAAASPASTDSSMLGYPPIKYGISAARFP